MLLDTDTKTLTVIVAEESRTDNTLLAKLSVNTGSTSKRADFRVTAQFSKSPNLELPSIPFVASVDHLVERAKYIPGVADVYRDWLFHGPMFRALKKLLQLAVTALSVQLEHPIRLNVWLPQTGRDGCSIRFL